MSWAFPKEILAKSGIAPIMCAKSRASKLDDISAKASAQVLHHGHTRVPGQSPSHAGAMARSSKWHAHGREPALGLPPQAGGMRKALSGDLKHCKCISEILQATHYT